MKTIFKFAIFSVMTFTVAVALLNWDDLKVFADTGKRIIEEKIDDAQSMETKLNLLETRIEGLGKEIYDLKTEVVRRKVDMDYLNRIVNEKELALLNLKEALERASKLLAEHQDYYLIGGRRYTHEAVARDAEEKMKLYKIQEETLHNLERTLDTKQKTLVLAEQNVAKGESIKTELSAKVKYLNAQVDRFKAKEVYAETVKVDDPTLEFKTLIGQTQKMLSEFEKQLEVKDRLLDERIRLGGDFIGGIDYASDDHGEPTDIAEEITIYFNGEAGAFTKIVMDR